MECAVPSLPRRAVSVRIRDDGTKPMEAEQLVSSWLLGRAKISDLGTLEIGPAACAGLPAKFRKAYHWICANALLSPYAELESGTPCRLERDQVQVELYDEPGYSAFVLLPLLNLMTSRRMVFVGAPGRGKTSMATLMGLLAGAPLEAVRRSVQHGHPQLTVQDLLGHPLPHRPARSSLARVTFAWPGATGSACASRSSTSITGSPRRRSRRCSR